VTDWTAFNREHWDERVAPHAASPDYAIEKFVADPTFLSDVVTFDLPRLGDIAGLRGVHLQCHIGTDTVSLARLGARMTGLDFSGPAVEQARGFAAAVGADVDFVQSDVYGALDVLEPGGYDFVFTGIGALCWLPDIRRWAGVVASLLRPGGRLFIREGHPMLWALGDPRPDGLLCVEYPYFEPAEPTVFDMPGTYVESDHEFVHTASADWNHGLGEIISALFDAGMQITMFVEHDSVPWDPLPGMTESLPGGEFRLADRPQRLAHSYTLQAIRV
jgi:SAM-dependent methyltransferase